VRRAIVTSLVALALVILARSASAEVVASAEVQLMPTGRLVTAGGGLSYGLSIDPTAAFAGALGYRFGRFSLALAPRVLPSLHPRLGEMADLTEVDVGARIAGHFPAARNVELLGFVTPGYSLLFDDDGGSHGLVVAVGGGATFRLRGRIALGVTVGYQHGNQHTRDGVLAASRLFLVGVSMSVVPR